MPLFWILTAAAIGYWYATSSKPEEEDAAKKIEPKKLDEKKDEPKDEPPPLKCLTDDVAKIASVKDVQAMFVKLGKLDAAKADGACTTSFIGMVVSYQKEVGAPLTVTGVMDLPTYTVLKASTTKVDNELAYAIGATAGKADALALVESMKSSGDATREAGDDVYTSWKPDWLDESKDGYRDAFLAALGDAGYTLSVQPGEKGIVSKSKGAEVSTSVEKAREAGKKDGEATALLSEKDGGLPVSMVFDSFDKSWAPSSAENTAYTAAYAEAVEAAGYVIDGDMVQSKTHVATDTTDTTDPLVEAAKELAVKDVDAAITYFETTKVPVKDSAQSYDPAWSEAARTAYESSFMAHLESRGYELSADDEVQPKGYVAPKLEPVKIISTTLDSTAEETSGLELKPAPFYSMPAIKL